MDKELIDWAKSVLLSHPLMPKLLNAITKENEKMQSLGYASRHYEVGQSTYDFLENMLALNIRKKDIYYLYINVREILRDMDEDERYILEERFFSRKGMDEIMPKVNIRTCYRRYNTALEHFASALLYYGYSIDLLDEKFGGDIVIGRIHRAVMDKKILFKRESKPHKKRTHTVYIESSEVAPRVPISLTPLLSIFSLFC